jgi:hypothetical protein
MILERKEKQDCCRKGRKNTCAICEKNANKLGIPITFTQFKLKIVVITQERLYSFLGMRF